MSRKGTDIQVRRKAVVRYIAAENIDVLVTEHALFHEQVMLMSSCKLQSCMPYLVPPYWSHKSKAKPPNPRKLALLSFHGYVFEF